MDGVLDSAGGAGDTQIILQHVTIDLQFDFEVGRHFITETNKLKNYDLTQEQEKSEWKILIWKTE